MERSAPFFRKSRREIGFSRPMRCRLAESALWLQEAGVNATVSGAHGADPEQDLLGRRGERAHPLPGALPHGADVTGAGDHRISAGRSRSSPRSKAPAPAPSSPDVRAFREMETGLHGAPGALPRSRSPKSRNTAASSAISSWASLTSTRCHAGRSSASAGAAARSRIEHWHPIDEGFSGRRPLEDLA